MEIPELAAADLVHPHPLPCRPHEHHLLGDVLERADALSRLLEALCRARREILDRSVRLGALARVRVQEPAQAPQVGRRSEEHTSELQSLAYLVCRLLLEKKKNNDTPIARLN